MADNKIENTTNMIRTTVVYDGANSSMTAGIGAYAGVLAQVVNKLVLIDALNIIATGKTGGVTLDTKGLKNAMCVLAGRVGQAVAAYANSVNNNTLLAVVNFTVPKLLAINKDDVDDTCEAIRAAANTNIGAAGSFGYVAGDVTDLGTAIALYRTSIAKPRQAVISKSQAIKDIKSLQKDISKNFFVGQLDKMAYTLKGGVNDTFYNGHTQARVIIDLGKTSGKIRGVANDQLGKPKQGVKFSVFKAGTTTLVKSVVTKADGKFSVTKLFGKYDVKWECAGCTTLTENGIDVAAGKSVTRTVALV